MFGAVHMFKDRIVIYRIHETILIYMEIADTMHSLRVCMKKKVYNPRPVHIKTAEKSQLINMRRITFSRFHRYLVQSLVSF